MATAIRCLAATYYGGFHIKPHRHHWGQLIYAAAGLMRVRAGATLWIVPPARAVWVPAGPAGGAMPQALAVDEGVMTMTPANATHNVLARTRHDLQVRQQVAADADPQVHDGRGRRVHGFSPRARWPPPGRPAGTRARPSPGRPDSARASGWSAPA